MNTNNSNVENCRELLNDRQTIVKNSEQHIQYIEICDSITLYASAKEKFDIAKQLLKELEEYDDHYYAYDVTSFAEQQKTYFSLLNSFHDYEGIVPEEFAFLLKEASLAVIAVTVGNASFPIDFLVEDSFLKRHETHLNYWALESSIKVTRHRRKEEIWNHYKSMVPGSENMNDKMILSILGLSSLPE